MSVLTLKDQVAMEKTWPEEPYMLKFGKLKSLVTSLLHQQNWYLCL